jgi:hypothetical protein
VTTDCRNDCVEPFEFPKGIYNRPGLPRIDYRIGTYSDFYEAILRNLNSDDTLRSWTHREPDDPGIALLEGASILGDILTFYQETYANEAYLRTARWRESVADLVRLLGYRLSPGLGGRATFAFEVRGDKPVVIPAGFPVKAQVEGLEQPAEFETVGETIAYPRLSKFNLYRRLDTPNIEQHTTEFYISSPDQYTQPLALEEGDRLLIGDPYPETKPNRLVNGEIVIVDSVREVHGVKLFRIKGALKRTSSTPEIAGYKLGRSFQHFGHNAPPKVISIADGQASESPISYERPLSRLTTSSDVEPSLAKTHFLLDEEVDDLPLGTPLICQTVLRRTSSNLPAPVFFTLIDTIQEVRQFALIRTIQEVRQLSCRWGAITGRSTMVILDSELTTTTNPAVDKFDSSPQTYDCIDIREVQFHEVLSPRLRLCAGVQETSMSAGKELYFYGTEAEAQNLNERQLLFAKPGDEPFMATVASTRTLSPTVSGRSLLRRVALDRVVDYADFPNENPIVTVYGNLVEATQGKTEREAVLGNGDSRQTFQTFKLPKAPLTYHNSVGETPPEMPELRIYVDDRLWKRVPSLFEREPGEEIYIVREDANGDSWVQFGDGKTGKRLPSGLGNVVARYRTGIGAYGGLREETTVQAGGKLDRLDKINLPGVASGGSEPESGENAREAAPGKIQSLDRLVSLKDFESETLAIAGVSRASATWGLPNNVPTVVLTVLMEAGRDKEFEQVRQIVADYNRCRSPQRFPVSVEQGRLQYVCIDADVALDPTYRPEVVKRDIKEALGLAGEESIDGSRGLFALAKRTFGQDEYSSRVAGIIQNVEGVLWTRVTALGSGKEKSLTDPCPPVVSPKEVTIPCDGRHVLALYAGGLRLNRVSVPSPEAC